MMVVGRTWCRATETGRRSIAVTILFVSLLLGCASAHTGAVASAGAAGRAQLIVKFRPAVAEPSAEAFVQTLSEDAGVKLVYVRPMNGDTHVFAIQGGIDRGQLDAVIRRLQGRPDVVYAEQNRILRHQR